MPGLNFTENIPRAAQAQIFHCDLKARAEIIKIKNNAQALPGRFGEAVKIRHDKTGKSLPIRSPHPPPKLVQLPKPKHLGLIHNKGVCPREIKPRLHNGRAHQNVQLAVPESVHRLLKRLFGELPVRHADSGVRHKLPHKVRYPLKPLHPIVHPENLAFARQFFFKYLFKCDLVPLQNGR